MLLSKLISRKFIAFILGTVFFLHGNLSENGWLILVSVYVGSNVIDKISDKLNIGGRV